MNVTMSQDTASDFLHRLKDMADAVLPVAERAMAEMEEAHAHLGLRGIAQGVAMAAVARHDVVTARAARDLARRGIFALGFGALSFDEQDMDLARELPEICARYGVPGDVQWNGAGRQAASA